MFVIQYFVSVLLLCYAILCVHSSFAIILKRKGKLVALLLHVLSYRCIVTINVLWHFLTVRWVSLQYVIVVFTDHTHLLFVVFDSLFIVDPIVCGSCFILCFVMQYLEDLT